MQYTKIVCATALLMLLLACGSNQRPEAKQQNGNVENSVINLSSIPIDGMLRAEHIRMYVSVKIKQEQLRYQYESQLQNNNGTTRVANKTNPDTKFAWEKLAIQHFEFDSEIYYWSKNAIDNTLQNDRSAFSELSSTEKSILKHNLSVIKKFQDDLNFARRYKLKLNPLKSSKVKLNTVSDKQVTLSHKPPT